MYKYDLTTAEDDGVWAADSYVSTGYQDEAVNTTLSPYAIEGVEFSYIKLADLDILKENEGTEHHVMPLYGFHEDVATSSRAVTEFLRAIGLTTDDAYTVKHDANQNRIWYFESDVLMDGLANALAINATSTKAALEAYMSGNGATAMLETDENGYSHVDGLAQGLYLVVETWVPENVTCTTEPFLVSLPTTSIDGTQWNYDPVLYPKNETGNPTLEKTVREALADTGKHGGSTTDITDGYAHTATGSDGDVMEYQIISTLPTITSPATSLTTYTFVDQLSKGIRYNGEQFGTGEVKLEFFTDAGCTDLITTWTETDGKFTVNYTEYDAVNGTQMTIAMTTAGLSEINSSTNVYDPDASLLRGYSNCTLRITYSCLVNSDATVVYGDSGNPNEVELTWKRTNTNYYDTLQDCCHVYTYGLDLTKKFSDGKGNFEKVSFLIRNKTDGYYVQAQLNKDEGIYYVTGHTTKEADATSFVPMSGEVNHGKVMVKGLEDDTYIITEATTDRGYSLLKENISVEIITTESTEHCPICEAAFLTASAKVNGKDVAMNEDNGSVHAIVPLTVSNTRNFILPKTGGNSYMLYYVVGGLLVLIGVVGLSVGAIRKRKQNKA